MRNFCSHADKRSTRNSRPTGASKGEEGYLLIGLVVAIFLITLFLTIAAPTVAKQLERDREVESEHRAQQYVQAIHLYYAKFKTYPTSIDQLLSSNDIHYLRQQYKDPLTGDDYRLIHQGEAKTEVKGFFGEPLEGVAQGGGLGALAGSTSSQNGAAAGTFGGTASGSSSTGSSFGNSFSSGSSSSGLSSGSSSGSSSFGNSFSSGSGSSGTSIAGSSGTAGADAGSTGNSTNTSATLGGTSATSFKGSKGAIVGVGSNKSGEGVVQWNGSANIQDWEFLYDPRVDMLKAQVSILGGTPGANGSGSLGTAGGSSNSLGSNTASFGSSSSSSGSSFGNSFGSGSSGNTSGSTSGNSSGSTSSTSGTSSTTNQ